jgi:hypothetical protein
VRRLMLLWKYTSHQRKRAIICEGVGRETTGYLRHVSPAESVCVMSLTSWPIRTNSPANNAETVCRPPTVGENICDEIAIFTRERFTCLVLQNLSKVCSGVRSIRRREFKRVGWSAA